MTDLSWIDKEVSTTETPDFGTTEHSWVDKPIELSPLEAIELLTLAKGSDQRKPNYKNFRRLPSKYRVSAAKKRTPAGVKSNLEAQFGQGNVFAVGDDNFAVIERDEEGKPIGKPMLLEEAGSWSEELWADFIDMVPDIRTGGLAGLGGAVGAGLGGPPGAAIGAGVGGYVGEKLTDVEAGLQPGEDEEGALAQEQRALTSGAFEAATSGLGGAVGKPVKQAIESAVSSKIPGTSARAVKKGLEAPSPLELASGRPTREVAVESLEEAGRSGTSMDLAEASLSAPSLARRAQLRTQNPELFRLREQQRAKETTDAVNNALDIISPKALKSEKVGHVVGLARKGLASKIKKRWKSKIDDKFAEAAEIAGSSKLAKMPNTKKAIKKITEAHGPTEELSRIHALMARGFKLDNLQDQLSIYGKASVGLEKIYSRLSPSENQRLGKFMFKALQADLNEAAKGAPGQLFDRGIDRKKAIKAAKALLDARSYTKDMYTELDIVQNKVLEKLIKRMAPGTKMKDLKLKDLIKSHKLVTELANPRNLSDSSVKKVFKTMDLINPTAGEVLRRGVMEDILKKTLGRPGTAEAAATGGSWNNVIQIGELMGDKASKDRILAVVGGDKKHPMYETLKSLALIGNRAAAAATEEAQLTGRGDALNVLRAALLSSRLGDRGLSGASYAQMSLLNTLYKQTVGRILETERATKAFLDPKAAGLIKELASPPKKEIGNPEFSIRILRELGSYLAAAEEWEKPPGGEEEQQPVKMPLQGSGIL